MPSEVRRGTIISFDATLWQAKILMDGADNEATIAVGQWVASASMTVDTFVAVLIFGETNTDDGLVLGPFGAGAPSSWDYPALSGLTTGQVLRATGAGAAAFGRLDLTNANAYDQTAIPTFGGINVGAAVGAATGTVSLKNGTGSTVILDTSAANQASLIELFDNGVRTGRLIYAGTNAGGSRYLGLLAYTADYLLLGTINLASIQFWTNSTLRMTLAYNGGLTVVGGLGINGAASQAAFASGGAAGGTLAQVTTLANNIRTALINDGIMS